MADLFTSLVAISQVGDIGDKPVPGTTPQVKKTFSAGRRHIAARTGPMGHILDANTLALWRMDNNGGGSEPDISGNGYNLTTVGDSSSIVGKIDYGRHLTGNVGQGLWTAAAPSAITPLHGAWTVEAWVKGTSGGSLVTFRPTTVNFGPDTPLVEFDVYSGQFQIILYYGALSWNILTSPGGVISATNWTHVAGRKRLNGAGPNYDLHLFCNGAQVAQLLNVPGPGAGDGTNVLAAWAVGSAYPGIGPGPTYSLIDVDDVRVSKVARTDVEILTSYLHGMG